MQNDLNANIERVEERLAAACAACGRERGDITLVAVSKKQSADRVREAVEGGLTVFGENRVQEAMAKMPELPGSLRWHLIGHLQTNKVRAAVHAEFELIHSVDSERLLLALEEAAAAAGRNQPLLLQVNVSGESSKFGLAPEGLMPLLDCASRCPHLELRGLMTIPPFTEDPENAAPHFARLRDLRDRAAASSGFPLAELSMGMSHDLEVAVREGATLVRIGTDLFGARPA
jgi:pyridoxal phosphate enzyme (YggS family)